MAKSKSKSKARPPRRIWRTLLLTVVGLVVLLLLFVSAFVFNPFEGSLPEVRDIVPRGVNFFVRKQDLADDFAQFPKPRFWSALADTPGFDAIDGGPLGQSLRRDGLERALQQAEQAIEQVAKDSDGWIDLMRDVIGEEVVFAGYNQDHSSYPPQPLAEPKWCLYTRVSWRVKAIYGLAGFGFVQSQAAENGVTIGVEDDLLTVTPNGQPKLYLKRHLDVLMVANNTTLLEQAQQLLDNRADLVEPIGQQPAYTDGAEARIQKWALDNDVDQPNVLEFLVEPNAFDGFRRFAARWPNPQNRDSMNERVLASFLNLKGWMQVTGGLIFDQKSLVATGQVGLNSKQHSPFQASFYTAEQQRRQQWLDPFLRMVPIDTCAAAALRMPAAEFLHAMVDALEENERSLINRGMQNANYNGERLNDVRDLIGRLSVAFQPRTGFVFRRNVPDKQRDPKTGELMVPVAAKSPMPQVAWVFWLRPGGEALATELVTMLRSHYANFGFQNVWHLTVPHRSGEFTERVTEFTNPQIPATGEIAMIVFREFFVVSNSGPLIRDVLRARYSTLSGVPSIRQRPEFDRIERELPDELSGFVWVDGENLVPVIDDYIAFADKDSVLPDMDWLVLNRPAAEEHIRVTKFPRYRSKASIPDALKAPGGEFDEAVKSYLNEKWATERTSYTAEDRQSLQQLRGFARLFKAAVMHVELQANYIRYQARLITNMR